MPVNRPRRIRVIIIIIIVLHRAQQALENNIDGSVWEVAGGRLARTLQMFNETVETSWTPEETAVDKAFSDFDSYVESTDDPDEGTVESLSDTLQAALTAAGY
jgi:hypothetical protein